MATAHDASDPLEAEADAAAHAVVGKRSAAGLVNGKSGGGLYRQVATAAVAASVAGQASVLVEDTVAQLQPGQMRKHDFLAKLEPAIKAVASDQLGRFWSVASCPYIARYLAIYGAKPAKDGEAFARRYTGSKATDADSLLRELVAKTASGLKYWKDTGKPPPDVAAADPAAASSATAAAMPGAPIPGAEKHDGPAIQKKAEGEPAAAATGPEGVLSELGEGEAIDASVAARMGSAYGASFGDVRIHTDATAQKLAREHSAHAFTIGKHVAFAPGKYQPGTVEGDALLAHELAHVIQQRGASVATQKKSEVGGNDSAAEHDADRGAAAAVSKLHGGKSDAKAAPAVTSDLQLQRCDPNDAEKKVPQYDAGEFKTIAEGDAFSATVKTTKVEANSVMANLIVELKYTGTDDPDTSAVQQLMVFNLDPTRTPSPKVAAEGGPDNFSKLVIDPYGDGTMLTTLSQRTDKVPGNWNPASRLHLFFLTNEGQGNDIHAHWFIKSKNALPSNGAPPDASEGVTDKAPVQVDLAATMAKQRLHDLVDDSRSRIDKSKEPWAGLVKLVDADAAKYTGPVENGTAEAVKLTRLSEALMRAQPKVVSLGLASDPDAYLDGIRVKALAMVGEVRDKFEAALRASVDGPAAAEFGAAESAFTALWFRLSGLYASDQGGKALLLQGDASAQQVGELRRSQGGRPQEVYQKLEMAAGVPGSTLGGPNGTAERDQRLREFDELQKAFIRGDKGVMTRIAEETRNAQVFAGVGALLSTIEVFHIYKSALTGSFAWMFDHMPGLANYKKKVTDKLGAFEGVALGLELKLVTALAGGKQPGAALNEFGPTSIAAFQSAIGDPAEFSKLCEDIQSRIKHVETAKALVKILAIVGASALSGGAAGAAVGGFLEGAGATAGVVMTGEFVAEVATFTMVSRAGNVAAFGGNQTSLSEDLITNALMMGFLKVASAGYAQVAKSLAKTSPALFKAGGAMTGFIALQAFAEMHTKIKTGKFMDMDERVTGMLSNAVMMTCMGLGESLVKGKGKDLRDAMFAFGSKTPGALERLTGQVTELSGELADLQKSGSKDIEKLLATMKKVEKLWNDQVKVLSDVAKNAPDNMKAEAAKKYQEGVKAMGTEIAKVDLQLAALGMDVDLGANQSARYFRQASPGFIVYKAEGLEVIREYYKEGKGTFTEVKDKPGLHVGKDAAGEIFFAPDDPATSFIDKKPEKPPTEAEAKKNRAAAEKAKLENIKRAQELRKLVVIEDGHCTHKFGRIVNGTGLAAALDANTLPGAEHGEKPGAIEALPATIGLGAGKDTFAKLGDTPIGQSAPELSGGGGWADGASPKDMTSNHGDYTSAQNIANATALTQYRSGVPILDGSIQEVSLKPDSTWKVPDAKVRIKAKLADGTDVYLYSDATDIATGLGPPREIPKTQVNADPTKAQQYLDALRKDNRLVYGDDVGTQRGGKVLVSGGSATGAWNAKVARELGGQVDWISRESNADPKSEAAKRRTQQIKDDLASGTMSPADVAKAQAELKELRAFDAAMLPRNTQAADAAMNDSGIKRGVKEIASMTPSEALGKPPGKIEVTFTDGTTGEYDQVVASHGTNTSSTGEVKGALTLAKGIELRPVVVDGKVVALESVNPPGALRVVGAAMWSRSWIDGDYIADPTARQTYENALNNQALSAPRDSPANPLINNVADQIPKANQSIGGGPDVGANRGAEVYGDNTKLDPATKAQTVVKLGAPEVDAAVQGTAKRSYASGAKVTPTSSATAQGATLKVEVPVGGKNVEVTVTIDVRPKGDLSKTPTHEGDAGPGRVKLEQQNGKWVAHVEVSDSIRPQDLQFALDHEINEIAALVAKSPDKVPDGGWANEMQAGVMTAAPKPGAKVTAHDIAAAREIVDLWNDWKRLEAEKSPDAPFRKGMLDRAMEANGMNATADKNAVAAKQDLLRDQNAPKDLIDRAKDGTWQKPPGRGHQVPDGERKNPRGYWLGEKGDSGWVDNRPEVIRVVGLAKNGEANPIVFRNGQVDFTPWSVGDLDIGVELKGEHDQDMNPIYREIGKHPEKFGPPDRGVPATQKAQEQAGRDWLRDRDDGHGGKGVTPHHAQGKKIQLIPRDVHKVQHTDMTEY